MRKIIIAGLLLSSFISRAQQGSPVLNETLKTELESILKRDQQGRAMVDSVQQQYGIGSKEFLALAESIALHDSINLQKVTAIITQYGWPGKSLVGDKANRAVFLVIQHAEPEAQKKYLPLLSESVKKGESNAKHLAYLEDRVLMREGKPQWYGTQLIADETTGKWKLYTIAEEESVDERRIKIGLVPLSEYVKQFGIEYKKPR
jgi:hypothetical protein